MATPSEILRKTKAQTKEDKEVAKDGDKDPKQGGKASKRNALIDFIAKNKKVSN